MDYILRYPLTENDVDFLNITSIECELINSHGLKPTTQVSFDSGWCDMTTGSRIINEYDRVIFKNVSDSDLTFLTLKFGSRLKELHLGMQEIYNVAEQHNASPTSVVDSESIV